MNIDQEFISGFDLTYQAIAYDLGGFDDGTHTIKRGELFNICCDYLRSYGDLSEDALEYWELLSSAERQEYAPVVFDCEFYEIGGAE